MIGSEFATACREFLKERLTTCRFFVPEDDGAVSLPPSPGGGAREDEADVPFGKDYVAAVARRDGGGFCAVAVSLHVWPASAFA
jgi:hypothetical protein